MDYFVYMQLCDDNKFYFDMKYGVPSGDSQILLFKGSKRLCNIIKKALIITGINDPLCMNDKL